MDKANHVGLIVKSESYARVGALLESYTARFYDDFFAKHPLPERPTS
jgi:hypothetical protein